MSIIREDLVYSGTLSEQEEILFTVPDNTTFIVKGIWISNSNADYKTASIKIDGKRFIPDTPIPAKNSLILDNLHIPIKPNIVVKGIAEVNEDLDYYIWGIKEVNS